MKQRWHDFPRKMQHPLLLATGFLPLTVFFLCAWLPQDTRFVLSMTLLYAGIYLLMAWLSLLVPGRFRFLIGSVGVALLFGLSCWLLPMREKFYLLFFPLGYSGLLWLSLPMAGWHREDELSGIWFIFCAILHVIAHSFLRNMYPVYQPPLTTLMLVSFLVFLLLAMLSLNRTSLSSAGQYRVQVPEHMRRRNLILTVGLFLLTLLIAVLPAIGVFLRRLWNGFIDLIIRFVNWFSSLFTVDVSEGGGGGSADMSAALGAMETPEPSLFQIIVEKLLFALAFVAGIALLIWMGYELWSKLKKVLKWIWQRMSLFSNAVLNDYEDEITDTRDDVKYEKINPLHRLRQRLIKVDEKKLTPAQRVRYRYLRLRIRHEEWSPASTARDTLPEEAAQMYERVRYGNQCLTEEEAQKFKARTRSL